MMWPQLSQCPHLRGYSFLLWSEICRLGGPADWLFEMDLCWREHTAILPLFSLDSQVFSGRRSCCFLKPREEKEFLQLMEHSFSLNALASQNDFFFLQIPIKCKGLPVSPPFLEGPLPKSDSLGRGRVPSTVAHLATHAVATCHIYEGHCHILFFFFFFYHCHPPHLLFF